MASAELERRPRGEMPRVVIGCCANRRSWARFKQILATAPPFTTRPARPLRAPQTVYRASRKDYESSPPSPMPPLEACGAGAMLCLVQMGQGRTGVVLRITCCGRLESGHAACTPSTVAAARCGAGVRPMASRPRRSGSVAAGIGRFKLMASRSPIPFGRGLGRAPRAGPAAPHAVALRGLRRAALYR